MTLKLTFETLIGTDLIELRGNESFIISEMNKAYNLMLKDADLNERDYPLLLTSYALKADSLIEEFYKLWYRESYRVIQTEHNLEGITISSTTAILQMDEEAFYIVQAMSYLLSYNRFLPIY